MDSMYVSLHTGKPTFTMEGTPIIGELTTVRWRSSSRYLKKGVRQCDIRDLLVEDPRSPMNKLELKFHTDHYEVVSLDVPVHHTEDVWKLFKHASSARTVGPTNANELSSRSHCLLRVTVLGENLVNGQRTSSRLWLVDLAGSERVENSGSVTETSFINTSLSALRDVIYALAKGKGSIPSYGTNELTRVLQSSLGDDCKTLMFVQISPSSADQRESVCSLNFACRARGVELGPARKQSIQTASKGTSRKEGASTNASAHGTGNKREKRAA